MPPRRRRRFLDANETTESPGQHVAVAVASRPAGRGRNAPLAFAGAAAVRWRWDGGTVSRTHEQEFGEPRDWWEWLEGQLHPKRRTWLWSRGAHGAFLLLGGWERVVARLLRVGFLLDKDPPWLLRFSLGAKRCTWVDERNYFGRDVPEETSLAGAARAVATRVQALLAWHAHSDLGCLGFTAADMAMRAYRHRFAPRVTRGELTHKDPGPEPARKRPICWPVPHDREHVHEDERQSYYGPLFTCYQLGRVAGPIYVADVQSFYASMMRGRFFPAQYRFSLSRPDLEKARGFAETQATVAAVRLCSPDYPYPARRAGRVGMALGNFDTVLAGPEFLHALHHGAVDRIHVLHVYRPEELFTPFVEWFWNARCAARHQQNPLIEGLCKDALVKMTGKWAQTSDRWEIDPKRTASRPWGYDHRYDAKDRRDVSVRFLGDTVQVHAGRKMPAYYFPAVSAYITSYARLHMQWVIDQIGSDEVYYNPVDCLHLSARGWRRLQKLGLVQQPGLGLFRLERVIDSAQYLGPGAYVRDGEPVVCGLPKSARHAGGTRYEFTRVESCCEVFSRPHSDTLLTRDGSADLDARTLWGRERDDGRVFPPLLDEPAAAADAEEMIRHRIRMEGLRRGERTRSD